MKVKSLSRVRLSTTPWTAAYQAPPSMGFSRQEYWSQLPLPSLEKWAIDLNRYFCREEIQMATKHEKVLNTATYQRNANQNYTKAPHFTPVRTAMIKKTKNKSWGGCGEKGTLLHCLWTCKLVRPLWKTYGGSSKN